MPRLSRALHALLASGEIDRREANHLQWERDNPRGAIRARAGRARDQSARERKQAEDDAKRGAGERVAGRPRVRRNRREY